MKILPALLSLLALTAGPLGAAPAEGGPRVPAAKAASVADDLFWIADARKMDAFLAPVRLPELPGADSRAVLPDTRTAWWDYARQAKGLTVQGKFPEARARIHQMLKLAAVYRHFGGLENVVRAEEIRYLAGMVAVESGGAITGRLDSPYLEKNVADCLAVIEAKAGMEKGQSNEEFWRHLRERARITYARLAGQPGVALR